jgi:hypothetical protein
MGFKNMSQICDSPWKDCKRIQRFVMAKFQAIFQAILHLSALPLIIHACSMLGAANLMSQCKRRQPMVSTQRSLCKGHFDSSFDDSFVSLSDRAEVADSPVVQVQSSPQNLEESQDLVNHSLSSGQPEMQSEATDGFAFSVEQLTCPVVIEIFCGSARLTASLKAVGFRDSFGVDHKLDKAVSAAKRLDLTSPADQLICMQWLKSPLVVGVFLAPPCGTCSLARNIKLRDSHGRTLHGPKPLRSACWPEGLPGLGPNDRARVSAANRLYDFLAKVVDMAHELGLIVVVENPRSSLFWLTNF